MNIKVAKFGGTSMANKEAILKVKDIIQSDPERRFIVVSAPGKRFKGDEKITDLLLASYEEKVNSGDCHIYFAKVRDRFTEIVREFGLTIDINKYLDEVEDNINKSTSCDYAASRGEYLSALVMSELLGFEFVDSAEIIKFNKKGNFDASYTNDLVSKRLSIANGAVIPGFYGTMPDGSIKTFTRGGSDFTGSIIARGVQADVYENWTDVDGFMTADPRIVDNPHIIDFLSYEELRELSYMGASVLHPASIFPLQSTNIPINVRNTFNPSAVGTYILHDTSDKKTSLITGIAGRTGFTTFFVRKALMNNEVGFCRKILSIFEYYDISIEHMPTGIDTMSLIVPNDHLTDGLEFSIIEKIRGEVNPDVIFVYKNIALIAIVGHGMSNQTGTAARVFTALAKANINIKMIDQGSSEINIIVGVNGDDLNRAIAAIYHEFF